jgi:IS1 family transposase/transposase-like protein
LIRALPAVTDKAHFENQTRRIASDPQTRLIVNPVASESKDAKMVCHNCSSLCKKFGKFGPKRIQRWRCKQCKRTFSDEQNKPLDDMRIPMDKATMALQLLLEGCAVASVTRVTGLHKRTILNLLVLAGERCEKLMEDRIKDIAVRDVACDEIWSYVWCHDKHKARNGIMDEKKGSKWCFIALERNTKMVLAWHLGERDDENTMEFTEKLSNATSGEFQVSTDGWACYRFALGMSLGNRISFAQQIKTYATDGQPDTRYSPAKVTKVRNKAIFGRPDMERVSTSHVERLNLELRMTMRRLTRLTLSYSKKLANHRAAFALTFAYHNFVRRHETLKTTPAMASGLTDHAWKLEDLLTATI